MGKVASWAAGMALGILVVLSSVVQHLLHGECLSIFGDTSYQVLLASWGSMAVLYGIPVIYGNKVSGGYLPEVKSRSLRRSFTLVAIFSAISSIMELFVFALTPGTLQASFSHLIVPFTVCFTLVANPAFLRIYSTLALAGCLLIVFGSITHMSIIYLSTFASIRLIAFHTTYLLAQVPTSWALVAQQQYFSVRRLNVFYFLFYVSALQFLIGLLLLPLNCMRDGTSLGFSSFSRKYEQFVSCILNRPGGMPHCNVAALHLALYILSTFFAQVLQALYVRRASYNEISTAMLAIPTLVFGLGRLHGSPYDVGRLVFSTHSLKKEKCDVSLVYEFSAYLVVLLGAALYRLDHANRLADDFVVSSTPFLRVNRKRKGNVGSCSYLQHSPMTYEPTPLNTNAGNLPVVRPTHTDTRRLPDKTHVPNLMDTSVQVDVPLDTNNDAISTALRQRTKVRSGALQVPQGRAYYSNTSRLSRTYCALPHESKGEDRPPILRPVLMNVWSGTIPCEYTDYKRNFDISKTDQVLSDYSLLHHIFLEGKCSVVKQYTVDHMNSVGEKEAALQNLYAYHIFGTQSFYSEDSGSDTTADMDASGSTQSLTAPEPRSPNSRRKGICVPKN